MRPSDIINKRAAELKKMIKGKTWEEADIQAIMEFLDEQAEASPKATRGTTERCLDVILNHKH